MVTRAGKPEMAFASCFGSPLLSHVLGLSIAMIVSLGNHIVKLYSKKIFALSSESPRNNIAQHFSRSWLMSKILEIEKEGEEATL